MLICQNHDLIFTSGYIDFKPKYTNLNSTQEADVPKGTILLTGATGALGGEILSRLVKEGYRVVALVRADNNEHAQSRLASHDSRRVTAIRGDITDPHCGISDVDQNLWKNEIGSIIHCAASISFTDTEKTSSANLNGVRHALDLADLLGVFDFRHISTTYVAGDADTFSEADLLVGQSWRNPYENSKYLGETLVRAWGQDRLRRYTILRPSILVGREDGTTPTFDAYYGYFRPLASLANQMRRKARKGDKLPDGVSVGKNGWVNLPLVLTASLDSTLNLISIDWVADMIAALQVEPAMNRCFHLAHSEPPMVRDVIRWSMAALKIRGFVVAGDEAQAEEGKSQQSPLLSQLQKRRVDPASNQFLPYTTHGTRFGTMVTELALGRKYRAPRTVGRVYLGQMMKFAEEANWGEVTRKVSEPV